MSEAIMDESIELLVPTGKSNRRGGLQVTHRAGVCGSGPNFYLTVTSGGVRGFTH